MLERWRLSQQISLIIFCIVVLIVTGIILINYFITAGAVQDNSLRLRDHSEQMINTSFRIINAGLENYDNSFNGKMENGFSLAMEKYNKTGGDLSQIDLQDLNQQLGMEISIINHSAVVVQSSKPLNQTLDFNIVSPDFVEFLNRIGNTSRMYPGRIVPDYYTGNLTKYAYMPTPDHKYVMELAYSKPEFGQQGLRLDYRRVMNQIKEINPDIDHARLFRKNFRLVGDPSYNATDEERSIISSIFADRQSREFEFPENKSVVKYLLIDMRNGFYGADMSLVAEITYQNNRLEDKLNRILVNHLILALIIIICGMLLSVQLSRRITRPIEDLVEDVDKVACGNLDHTIRTGASIELRSLQESTIRLVSSIRTLVYDLKQEKEKLLHSEERYRKVVETQAELICRFKPDGSHLFVSDAYARFFGKSIDEMLSSRFTPEMTQKERQIMATHLSLLNRETPSATIEQQVLCHDGTIRWVQWNDTAIFGEDGTVFEYQSVGRDITNLKLLEENLRASDLLYRSTINAMVDGVHVIDRSYTILLINNAFHVWIDLPTAESLINQNLFDVFPFLDEKIKAEYIEVFETGRTLISEDILNQGNVIIHAETRKIPIWLDGRVEKIVTIIRDTTDKHRAEIAQQNMNQMLEHEVRIRTQELETIIHELDSFTYTISHDLRAPLRAIDGFAHILTLKTDPDKQSDTAHYLGKIHENIRFMDLLIDDLLTFSQMSRRQIELTSVNMQVIAEEVSSELMSSYSLVRFEVTIDELPPAHGDLLMLRQVLMRLLSNAMKFSQKQHKPKIRVGYTISSGVSEYFVQDNGIGFDMQYANKIFDVFLRLHPAGEYEGTGVGLAIVKRVIIRHGGHIRVISEEGFGTTFFFTVGTVHGTK
ncbi:MAG TPA: PAS domain S-box protein [Methanospirillum sp.]|uniref:PAS domain S-box protein n=1 Tax=Methanospirillum sp. TaxID=45200 RepID=UPI002C7EC797|nr:PAS domain S-box protein [Methanospirillum sp.]HWQ64768.1 PAS domain S-box protein [Methanospirillum sp.]